MGGGDGRAVYGTNHIEPSVESSARGSSSDAAPFEGQEQRQNEEGRRVSVATPHRMGTFDEELAAEFDAPPPPPPPPKPTATEPGGVDFSIVTGANDPAARGNDQVRPATDRTPPLVY